VGPAGGIHRSTAARPAPQQHCTAANTGSATLTARVLVAYEWLGLWTCDSECRGLTTLGKLFTLVSLLQHGTAANTGSATLTAARPGCVRVVGGFGLATPKVAG